MLTGLLSPQPTTTFRGRYYQLTGARCDPKPVQQPHPPICIGGHGERRTLRTAALGEAGAELVIVSLPPPHTPAVLEPLASALAELPAAALSRPGRRAT